MITRLFSLKVSVYFNLYNHNVYEAYLSIDDDMVIFFLSYTMNTAEPKNDSELGEEIDVCGVQHNEKVWFFLLEYKLNISGTMAIEKLIYNSL